MPVDQLPPKRPAPGPRNAKLVRYEEYIDTQIQHTRRLVRTVDIATVLLVLTTGVLAYLLTVAVAEHWLVTGGFGSFTRILLFAALASGAGYYAIRRLWPLCVRSINPAYAAHTIEQGSPSLKNSLLNLLLFRQKRGEISDAVYATLEEQAAQRLVRVPVDTAVDRSHLVRMGYLMIAIVTACALYEMFSPKDPLIAAKRVLMPWADIAPASRVSISHVEPGAVTIARGDVLQVSAEVHGLGDDDPVTVRYTTSDNQVVDRAAQLKPVAGGFQFAGPVPAPTGNELGGVAQDISYRIEAGDARTPTYKVTVVAAPTITVERVDYDYPAYTGFADRSVDGLGDIRAIEGTRVTIHARANEPIEEANVDFEADGRLDQRMTSNGTDAEVSFVLALRSDHQTPKYSSYVLRFTGAGGHKNRQPVKFPIDVLPDYAPEVSIRMPQERSRDLRLDETLPVEIEARDPDFSLLEVRVRGEIKGRVVFDEPLLTKPHSGRFAGRVVLAPTKYRLQPGDVVQYFAVAHDNRAPEPNEATSEQQTFRILSPNPNQPQQPPDRVAQRDQKPDPQQDRQQDQGQGQQQDSGDKGGKSRSGGKQANGNQKDAQPGDSKQQDSTEQSEDGGKSQDKSGGQSGKSKSGKDQDGQGQSSADGESSDSQQDQQSKSNGGKGGGNDSKQSKSDSKQQPSGGGQSSGDKSDSSQSSGDRNNSNGQNQSGSKADQPSAGGDAKSNGKPDAGQSAPQKGERGQSKPDDSSSPVSSEGDNDGEAFDRIQKFLERQGQTPKQGGKESGKQSGNQSDNQSQSPAGDPKQPSGDQQQSGDQKQQSGNQQQPGNQQQTGKDQQSNGQQGQDKSSDKPKDGQQSARDQGQDKKSNGDSKSDPAGKNSQPNQNGDANQSAQKNDNGQSSQSEQSGAAKDSQGENSGAKNDGQKGEQKPKESESKGDGQKSPNGGQSSSKGQPGAGQQEKHDGGTPESQPNMKPTDKWQQKPSDKDSKDSSEPQSGARGKRESDSQGDQGGDKTGGGSQGAGQKSNHDGTGSSGQNQSADKGDGESSEKGKGQNSPDAGRDAASKDRTGQSGSDQRGAGSEQRDGKGNQQGGQNGRQPPTGNGAKDSQQDKSADGNNSPKNQSQGRDANPVSRDAQRSAEPSSSDANKSNPEKSNDKGQQKPSNNGAAPSGGQAGSTPNANIGPPPNGAGGPNKVDGTAPEADDANLVYARKQTDMVLEKLSDQMRRKQLDRGLLNELGWNEQDLKRFLDRWQQLKTAANGKGPDADAARGELDAALRSLGLRHGNLQQSKATKDDVRDLREGYRGAVPLEYQERLRAYNQGVSRARSTDE